MSSKHNKLIHKNPVNYVVPSVPRSLDESRPLHNRRATDRAWNSPQEVIELLPKVDFSLTASGAMKDYIRRARLQYAQLAIFQRILDNHPQYRHAKEHKILTYQAERAAHEIEQLIQSYDGGIPLAVLPSILNERHEALLIERQYEPHVILAAHILREAYLVALHLNKQYGGEYRLSLSDPVTEVRDKQDKSDFERKRSPHMRRSHR